MSMNMGTGALNTYKHTNGFIKQTRPKNLFSLIDKTVVEDLFVGHTISQKTPVGIVFAESFPVTIDNLQHEKELEELRRESDYVNQFCWLYREEDGHNNACMQYDKKIALKYYNEKWKEPKLYLCHLKLWEMAYPICVNGSLLGVLIAGQSFVRSEHKWHEELKELIESNNLVWNSFDEQEKIPECSAQVRAIEIAIDAQEDLEKEDVKKKQELSPIAGIKHYLKQMLFGTHYHVHSEVDKVKTNFSDFKAFGDVVQKLVQGLYDARKEEARRIQIHDSSKRLSEAGDRLSEQPQELWNVLDEVIQNTLPDVKGYVFYRLEKYGEDFEPLRTCIYDKQLFSIDEDFRSFCKSVSKEALKKTERRRKPFFFDITSKGKSAKFHDSFHQSIKNQTEVSGGATAVVIPLVESEQKTTGGLVCVCVREKEIKAGESSVSEGSLKFYVETLRDIAEVLSVVLARHSAEEAQAAAWVVRSHELVSPIHAVKGYQDNLKYVFRRYIDPVLSGIDKKVKEIFEKRLNRLEALCDLQELIVTSVSLEEEKKPEDFSKVDFQGEILLPIVQPLRDFAINEKEVSVYYRREISNIPELFLLVGEMKRCVFNLIFNAIKYSDDYSTVDINLEQTDQDYEIHFSNKGIGVPKGEEEQIFLKFQQGSNSGKKAAYGSGLGLSVARRIARLHAGDVKLINGETEKTVFGLILPKFLRYEPPTGL